jgi:2-polyprenyl-3-methyl-5-hydroxy-6-metoxy-1,4-benzoquinol methylase
MDHLFIDSTCLFYMSLQLQMNSVISAGSEIDPGTCLLCEGTGIEVLDSLTGVQIRSLWQGAGMTMNDECMGLVTENRLVKLYQCKACNFRFYDPMLAGNAMFYSRLTGNNYYANDRPEFFRTREFSQAVKAKRIMDVGCGGGAFLKIMQEAGFKVIGLELNTKAIAQSRAQGFEVHGRLLHELTPDIARGQFDLISLFQVLEHVPNPVLVMRQAAQWLAPEGHIAISVPAEEGIIRITPYDVSNWPPHHVSRWHRSNFETLSQVTGLRLVSSGTDQLFGSEIEQRWLAHNQSAQVLGKSIYPGGNLLPKVISQIYRKLGLKHLFKAHGNSHYAFFQKV